MDLGEKSNRLAKKKNTPLKSKLHTLISLRALLALQQAINSSSFFLYLSLHFQSWSLIGQETSTEFCAGLAASHREFVAQLSWQHLISPRIAHIDPWTGVNGQASREREE